MSVYDSSFIWMLLWAFLSFSTCLCIISALSLLFNLSYIRGYQTFHYCLPHLLFISWPRAAETNNVNLPKLYFFNLKCIADIHLKTMCVRRGVRIFSELRTGKTETSCISSFNWISNNVSISDVQIFRKEKTLDFMNESSLVCWFPNHVMGSRLRLRWPHVARGPQFADPLFWWLLSLIRRKYTVFCRQLNKTPALELSRLATDNVLATCN